MKSSPQWKISSAPVHYEHALMTMETRVNEIHAGRRSGLVWLLEHPPLYTSGTNVKESEDLKIPRSQLPFPLYPTGRGGRVTYHGPGQRIIYCMLDLTKLSPKPDIKHFIHALETWIIDTLKDLDVPSFRQAGQIGVWTQGPGHHPAKIAAIGVRIRHWISFHGISLNIFPDLTHYDPIIPCGIQNYAITSLKALGVETTYLEFDHLLKKNYPF